MGRGVQSSPNPVVGLKCWQHAPCSVYGQRNCTSRAAVVAARVAVRRVEMCILIYEFGPGLYTSLVLSD
jgi:putative component of membrane protein insertase Oxa1/YidC/SpoIIIJ protein YidD